jgi:hypothetical protein
MHETDETGWCPAMDQASRADRYCHYFVSGGRIDAIWGSFFGPTGKYPQLRRWIDLLGQIAAPLVHRTGNGSDELLDAVVALRTWVDQPKTSSDALCVLLVDPQDEIRTEAFRVLSQLGIATDAKLTERFWPYVRKGLDDRQAEIRLLMLQSLKFPPNHPLSPDAFESVLCALRAPEAPVRCMSLRVLREFWPERVLAALDLVVALIKDPDPSVRLAVCELLEWLEVDALSAIPDLVKVVARDNDSHVCHAAAVALCMIDPWAKSVDLGPDDDELRSDFIRGLMDVGEPATEFRRFLEARWLRENRPRLKGLQLVPPDLADIWEVFSDLECELLLMAWLHRRTDGLAKSELLKFARMESDKDDGLFRTRLSQIGAKLKKKGRELPLERKDGKVFWRPPGVR